jgi:hypothetical protein
MNQKIFVPVGNEDWTLSTTYRSVVKKFLTTALAALLSALTLPAQSIQPIYSFTSANGASPNPGLTLGPDGNFHGTSRSLDIYPCRGNDHQSSSTMPLNIPMNGL